MPLWSPDQGRGRSSTPRILFAPFCLLVVMAISSLLAGITGYQIAKASGLVLPEPLGSRIPKGHHHLFFADSLAHLAAYGVGVFGGIMLCVWVLVRRWRDETTWRWEELTWTSPPNTGLLSLVVGLPEPLASPSLVSWSFLPWATAYQIRLRHRCKKPSRHRCPDDAFWPDRRMEMGRDWRPIHPWVDSPCSPS